MGRIQLTKTALSELYEYDFYSARDTLRDILDSIDPGVMPISPIMLKIYKDENIRPGDNSVFVTFNDPIFVTLTLSAYLMLDYLIDVGAMDWYQIGSDSEFHTMQPAAQEAALADAPHWGIVQALEYLLGISNKIVDPYISCIDYAIDVFECVAIAELEAERRSLNIMGL